MKLLVKDCEYGQAADDIVRDRIVVGTKSAKVCEQFIDTGADLTLQKDVEIARVEEIAVQQLKEMKDEPEQEVHAVKKKPACRQKDSKSKAHVVDVVGNMVMLPALPWGVCRECNAKNHFEKMTDV